MKIQYRNKTLRPNNSLSCMYCDLFDCNTLGKYCFGMCEKILTSTGFSVINDCEVLEL